MRRLRNRLGEAALGRVGMWAAMIGAPHARAQVPPEWEHCSGANHVARDERIKACTTLIESPQTNQHIRAMAFDSRGIAYRAEGELDRAIADYTESIRLDRT